MVAPVSYRCRNHPERPAIGLCVQCRAPVCADCTTKVKGINNCLDCLKRRAGPTETSVRRAPRGTAPLQVVAAFAFFWLVFSLVGALLIGT